jgi:Fur family ferric uptake transcriptional regulator
VLCCSKRIFGPLPTGFAVLQYVHSCQAPATHAEVTEKLTAQGLESSTIFRALNEMAEAGLLARMELGDHVWRYEVSSTSRDGENAAHPHFLCVDCGSIVCLNEMDMNPLQKKSSGAGRVGQVTEVLFKGHCHDCRE